MATPAAAAFYIPDMAKVQHDLHIFFSEIAHAREDHHRDEQMIARV